jgi:hypothetical protein
MAMSNALLDKNQPEITSQPAGRKCLQWVTCGRRPGKNFLTFLQHWSGAVR